MREQPRIRRRSFLRLHVVAVAAVATAGALYSGAANAVRKLVPAGVPFVSPDDPQAKALGYVPDVAEVTSESQKPREAGQQCSSCQLYSGTPGASWGPCAIFSYRTEPVTNKNLVVSADGWCKGWAPRAG